MCGREDKGDRGQTTSSVTNLIEERNNCSFPTTHDGKVKFVMNSDLTGS